VRQPAYRGERFAARVSQLRDTPFVRLRGDSEKCSDSRSRRHRECSFIAATIDVDDPDAAAALSRYGVGPTPNTIITDPQGKVLQQKEGGMGKADFLELLGKLNPRSNR
jgi:hypothetical protein